MMDLKTQTEWAFSNTVRERGRDYFARGYVEIDSCTQEFIVAYVKNGRGDEYSVEIEFDELSDEMEGFCDCPYFEEHGVCKHLWATILQVDEDNRIKAGVLGRTPKGGSSKANSGAAKGRAAPKASVQPEWMGEFVRLRSSAGRGMSVVNESPGEAELGRSVEYWYAINVSSSISAGAVVIDLVTRKQRADGKPGAIKPFALGRDSIRDVHGPHRALMQEILDFALPQFVDVYREYYYSYGQQSEVSSVTLKPVIQRAVLPKLAASGRLCWRLSSDVSMDEVQMIHADDGQPWRFHVDFERDDDSGWTVRGRLSRHAVTRVTDAPSTDESSHVSANSDADSSAGSTEQSLPTAEMPTAEMPTLETPAVVPSPADAEHSSPDAMSPDVPQIQTRLISVAVLMVGDSLVLFADALAQLDCHGCSGWAELLRRKSEIRIADAERSLFIRHVLDTPQLSPTALPPEFCPQHQAQRCVPRLRLLAAEKLPYRYRQMKFVFGNVDFLYDDTSVSMTDNRKAFWRDDPGNLLLRDSRTESQFMAQLSELDGQTVGDQFADRSVADVKFPEKRTTEIVHRLLESGWEVEAEGVLLKRPGQFRIGVTSGQDWFELNAVMEFEGNTVTLPELLKAVRSGENFVRLGDGTRGMLPEEWLNRYGSLADLGETDGDAIRFRPSQAMILDALLEAQDNVSRDRSFTEFCRKLRTFSGIRKKTIPKSFDGELRDYQKDGFNWLGFLNEFRLGGCLADDMG
ncbi:MAG: SNF2 helicase associated domain-containing protein, partial [Planctomycetaceae bacterium]|nr:SNF2 helicase associated domain-containing protein [Planctomycetaceae bacterium]